MDFPYGLLNPNNFCCRSNWMISRCILVHSRWWEVMDRTWLGLKGDDQNFLDALLGGKVCVPRSQSVPIQVFWFQYCNSFPRKLLKLDDSSSSMYIIDHFDFHVSRSDNLHEPGEYFRMVLLFRIGWRRLWLISIIELVSASLSDMFQRCI